MVVPLTSPGVASPRPRFRPFQRRSAASLPTPLLPDPLAGVLTVEIISRPEPGCDPVLYGLWMSELRTALNATPRLRVVDGANDPLAPDVAPMEWGDGNGWTDLRLDVTVRRIEPFRPMRIDADLCLTDRASGALLARLDGVWQAPVDGVPLKPTRQGWFRRDWRPPPALSEAAALEANSPRMFLRGTAVRMAETLAQQVDAVVVCPATESGW
jgi:hypothetical protein